MPISSKEQLVDFFTKALPPPTFTHFISKLGMLDLYHASAYRGMLSYINTKGTHTDNKENADANGNATSTVTPFSSAHTLQHSREYSFTHNRLEAKGSVG